MTHRMITALVADDEPAIRDNIAELLERSPEFTVAASCRDGAEAFEALERNVAEVAFLDVRMPELDGFEVIEALDPGRLPYVVFVTAYDEYALKAFDVNAVDYLLKPFDDQRFSESLARLRDRLTTGIPRDVQTVIAGMSDRRPLERIVVKDRGRVRLINVNEVSHLTAADNYVKVHNSGKTHLVRFTIAALAERLDPTRFIRIHRSIIVNLSRVQELTPTPAGDHHVVLDDGTRLTLSRSFRAAFEEQLGWRI